MDGFSFANDDDDDYNDNGCVFTFEDIAREETKKVNQSLNEIEEKLYGGNVDNEPCSKQEDDYDFYRRFDYGYAAHSDTVSNKEIIQWQETFSYLRIVGKGYNIDNNDTDNDNEMNIDYDNDNENRCTNNSNSNSDSIINTNLDLDLSVIGSRKVIHATTDHSLCTEEFEEYDPDVTTIDGTLDECLIVDRSNISNNTITNTSISEELLACNDVSEMSPELSQKDEMLNIMIDAIWPDVVDALEPLMIRMIKLCRQKGIYYDE